VEPALISKDSDLSLNQSYFLFYILGGQILVVLRHVAEQLQMRNGKVFFFAVTRDKVVKGG
jgi:hypothetical protein